MKTGDQMDQELWGVAERTVTPLIHPWTPDSAQILAPSMLSGNVCGKRGCAPSSGPKHLDGLSPLSLAPHLFPL